MFGEATSNFSQIRSGNRFDISALVSQFQQRRSGEINVSLDSIRERLSSNPAARELIQQKIQGSENGQEFLNRVSEKAHELGIEINLEPKAQNLEGTKAGTQTEASPQMEESVAATIEVPVDSGVAPTGQPRREMVRARIMDRLNGELPEFVVLAEDGTIDREATREIIRGKVADGEVADKVRDRIKDRLDGKLPEFVVLAEDGTIDREATRENIHAKVKRPDSGPAPTPLAAPSPVGRYDVNRDGALSPLDALTVINVLNGRAVAEVTTYDVNQDGVVSPLDALLVINRLNNRVVPQDFSTYAIDSFFAEDDEDEDETLFF